MGKKNSMKRRVDCLTGACPPVEDKEPVKSVKLSEGGGGREMQMLLSTICSYFPQSATWKHMDDDAASFRAGKLESCHFVER